MLRKTKFPLIGRTYPTVEKRALIFSGAEHHVSLPDESILYDATLEELGLRQAGTKVNRSSHN